MIFQTSGAVAIIDATINNTPIFVRTSAASNGKLDGSIVINNAKLVNVPTAVSVEGGPTLLAGGTTTITSWGQGNVYKGSTGGFTQGAIVSANKPSSLLDSSGKIFGRTHPQYANFAVSQFVSVKDNGAKGDGKTDDTAAITAIFQKVTTLTCVHLTAMVNNSSIFCSSRVAKLSSLMLEPMWSLRQSLFLLALR